MPIPQIKTLDLETPMRNYMGAKQMRQGQERQNALSQRQDLQFQQGQEDRTRRIGREDIQDRQTQEDRIASQASKKLESSTEYRKFVTEALSTLDETSPTFQEDKFARIDALGDFALQNNLAPEEITALQKQAVTLVTPDYVRAFKMKAGLLAKESSAKPTDYEIFQQNPEEYRKFKEAGKAASTGTPSSLARLIAEREALPEGSPLVKTYDSAISKSSKPEEQLEQIELGDGTFIPNGGKRLQGSQVRLLSEGAQMDIVLAPMQKWLDSPENIFGPLVGLKSLNPFATKTKQAESDIRRATQIIGKFMEGGVLRKEDEIKYRKMLPDLYDDEPVAEYKLSQVRQMLKDKTKEYVTDFGASGYDVSAFAPRIGIETKADNGASGGWSITRKN